MARLVANRYPGGFDVSAHREDVPPLLPLAGRPYLGIARAEVRDHILYVWNE